MTTRSLPSSASSLFSLLSDAQAASAQEQIRRPGAVIERLVSPSPGFYSGTFSGERAHSPEDHYVRAAENKSQKLGSWTVNARALYPFFSGLLSGTLASSPQSSISQHQHGIAVILQILDDLLKAPYRCQGPPPAPSGLHCPASNTKEAQSKAESKTATGKRKTDRIRSASGEPYDY